MALGTYTTSSANSYGRNATIFPAAMQNAPYTCGFVPGRSDTKVEVRIDYQGVFNVGIATTDGKYTDFKQYVNPNQAAIFTIPTAHVGKELKFRFSTYNNIGSSKPIYATFETR
jgi:hypothetical protein